MKSAPFDYVRPADIDEACQLLAEAAGGAVVLAGGQTLMPLLNLRMSQPFILIDLGCIADLRAIARCDGGISVGAMAVQNHARADALLQAELPLLVQALSHVGHHQTRNRGTIGGSIAFAEPAAECPAAALALDAEVQLRSVRGTRSMAMEDFLLGPYMTAIEPDEIITAIRFPDPPAGTQLPIFAEVARRPGDFALVGLAGQITLDGGTVVHARLAWFGMGLRALRARQAEDALLGKAINDIDALAIADLAVADTQPFDDKAASASYRETVGRRIFARAIKELIGAEVQA